MISDFIDDLAEQANDYVRVGASAFPSDIPRFRWLDGRHVKMPVVLDPMWRYGQEDLLCVSAYPSAKQNKLFADSYCNIAKMPYICEYD